MSDLTVANTILAQLGGAAALRLMTGAKDFIGSSNSLMFGIPGAGFAKSGINKVRVTLMPDDLYDVEFIRVRRVRGVPTATTVASRVGVYAEDLRGVFSRETGLTLSIPRVRGINA